MMDDDLEVKILKCILVGQPVPNSSDMTAMFWINYSLN